MPASAVFDCVKIIMAAQFIRLLTKIFEVLFRALPFRPIPAVDRIDDIMNVQMLLVGMDGHNDLEVAPLFQPRDILLADLKRHLRREVVPCMETLNEVRVLPPGSFSEKSFRAYHALKLMPDHAAGHIDKLTAVCFSVILYII